jgi:hypothetical protein
MSKHITFIEIILYVKDQEISAAFIKNYFVKRRI